MFLKVQQKRKFLFQTVKSVHKNLLKVEKNQQIFQLENFVDVEKIKKFEQDGWPIFKREKEEKYLEKYLTDSNIKKTSIFVVGQDGHGKSTLINKFLFFFYLKVD